jgi:hypothetical protein
MGTLQEQQIHCLKRSRIKIRAESVTIASLISRLQAILKEQGIRKSIFGYW